MTDGHSSIADRIRALLEYARPGGATHKRLMRYLAAVDRGTFLGPAVYADLARLAACVDNVECTAISREGVCRKRGITCEHRGRYAACPIYESARPMKGAT